MKKKVWVYFERESRNTSLENKQKHRTVGIYEEIGFTKVLTYFDKELDEKFTISFDQNEVLTILSKSKLVLQVGHQNLVKYETDHGNLLVKTKASYLSWEDSVITAIYQLEHNNKNIGDFVIRITMVEIEEFKNENN